jgi:uncharacterized membrane protein
MAGWRVWRLTLSINTSHNPISSIASLQLIRITSILGMLCIVAVTALTWYLYAIIMRLAMLRGYMCHRLPERSFTICGKQLPVCARCTGFYSGTLAGIFIPFMLPILLILSNVSIFLLAIILTFPMAIDGTLQRISTYQSTNLIRLITGLLCGVGLGVVINRLGTYLVIFLL